jgi:hypothetical protein
VTRLQPSDEDRAERASDGHGRQRLTIAFQREERGRNSSGNENQRTEKDVLEIVFHWIVSADWTTAGRTF